MAAIRADSLSDITGIGPIGPLTQIGGTSGCVSETGTGGSCVNGRGLDGAGWVAMAPTAGGLTKWST
jgi:hypothetical protein